MKKFEETCENLNVPHIKDDPHEQVLRNKLEEHYFSPVHRTRIQLKWAVGFAVFFFVIAVSLVLQPKIALKAHNITFRSTEVPAVKPELPFSESECLRYTSIRNPKLRNEIDPNQYQEDKAYVIRKYRSKETNDAVLIVSEFDKQPTQLASNQLF